MGTFVVVVLGIAYVVVMLGLVVKGIITIDDSSGAENPKKARLIGRVMLLGAALMFAIGLSFIINAVSEDKPCARYDYTYINGQRYKSCAEYWEEAD